MRNYLTELIKRKDLLVYLVKSGLKAENRNSYLGYFWWLLDPLLNVLVYFFLIAIVLGRGGDDKAQYAVYLVIGLVVWRWMNTTVTTSAKSIMKYSSIINQVYLPKSIFPLSMTFTQGFNFVFGLVVVAVFLAVFGVVPGWQIIYLPFIILVQLLFLLALSLFVAYICVFIRDIDNILSHILRVFFYASPIIWMGRELPEQYALFVQLNPVATIIESYRAIIMYQSNPHFIGLLIIAVISTLVICTLVYHYSKNEHKIIKAL
ncbi:ABC transporter permease [Alteribacter keqinensis]|uniref:Transport permease protein n=1 Tax=Alteribacter keqinensis TaxID=2483800 RepID=A0A3M7TS86_9BACI|nr:ABC transporter permease [Alteribacter keqinensis]RNA67592.1 ABC transporter permease [Alteribacter keqinensis]